MCQSMVDVQPAAAEIRREIKKKIDRKKLQGKNRMFASATQGGHKKLCYRTAGTVERAMSVESLSTAASVRKIAY